MEESASALGSSSPRLPAKHRLAAFQRHTISRLLESKNSVAQGNPPTLLAECTYSYRLLQEHHTELNDQPLPGRATRRWQQHQTLRYVRQPLDPTDRPLR